MRNFNFGARLGWLMAEKTAPFSAPVLLSLAAMPLAIGAHLAWGDDPIWIAVVAVTAAALTMATYLTWSNVRSRESRNVATIFCGLVLGWITFAAASSPFSRGMLSAWGLGTVALGILWGVKHAGHKPASEHDKVAVASDPLGGRIAAFRGGRTKKIKETEDQLTSRIQMVPGEATLADVQASKDTIASAASVGRDQVTVLPVKGREDQVDVAFTRPVDMDTVLSYTGPSAPGKSVAAAPLRLGRRVDSSDIAWWLCGNESTVNPRVLAHTLATGMTGSGKTETICTAILDMRWRTDVVPIVGDPAKFGQSFGDIEDCLGLAAKTPDQVKRLVRNLSPLVEYRAGLLGSLKRANGQVGYKQWIPECYTLHGIPLVFIDIEEAADVAGDLSEELDEAVRKLRSIGVHLCVSMQTAPFDNIARKTRGQFGQSLAHGCSESQDAKFSLNPATLDAGADPTKWTNEAPGSLYAELVGTDKVHWPVDGRVTCMTYEQKRTSVRDSKQYWAVLDKGTLDILGRGILLQDGQSTAGLKAVPDALPEQDDDVPARNLHAVPTEEGVIDVTQPLQPPTGMPVPFGDADSNPRMTTEDARRTINGRIDELEAGGQDEVGFGDLADLSAVTGRSRPWIYGELQRLVDEGRLKAETGKPPYRIRQRQETAVS